MVTDADLAGRQGSWKPLAKSSLDRGREQPAIFTQAPAMSIARTIVTLLIALSVAILPAAASAGVSVKSPEAAGISMTEDMPDCCPHKANPCEKATDDCAAMATCALKCFSFSGTSAVIVFPSAFAKMTASFAANPFSSQAGSPPFRPPRA
jgi:hypothetical protein